MFAEILLGLAAAPASLDADPPRASIEVARDPATTDAERVERALAWLERRVARPEWSEVDPGRANASGKRMVADALVAWLELVRDDRTADGAARTENEDLLTTLDARIRAGLGARGVALGGFANWTDGFAALYFAERELRGRGGRDALERIARGFESRQNSEGGWDHGASFGVPFYPSTLIATTNLATIALGLARAVSIEVDGEVVDAALELLGDVQAPGGGMPYGGRPYTKGVEAGRTCGTVLALASFGLGGDPRCARAAGHVLRNVGRIPDGHASHALHVFFGALACSALGEAAAGAYDEHVLARVRAAQRDDGSFAGIVAGSPDEMPLAADEETNRAYVTALHAAALVARGSKLAHALRVERVPDAANAPDVLSGPDPETLWHAAIGDVRHVAFVGERALAVDDEGHGRWLPAAEGVASQPFDLGLGAEIGELASASDDEGVLVSTAPTIGSEVLVLGGSVRTGDEAKSPRSRLAFVSIDDDGPRWSRAFDGRPIVVLLDDEHVLVRTLSGRVDVLARADGALVREISSGGVLPSATLCRGAGGSLVFAAEARLASIEIGRASGDERGSTWERKNRLRGLTPSSWTAVASAEGRLVAGRTDGSVLGLDPATGATRWEARTGSSIRAVVVDPGSGRSFVLTDAGMLTAIDAGDAAAAGETAWTRDADGGIDSAARPELQWSGGRLWVASPAQGALACLDPKDGRVLARIAREPTQSWSARGRVVVVTTADGVRALRAP